MLNTSYEQGGVAGPNGNALLKSLQGGAQAPMPVPVAAPDLSEYDRRGGGTGGSALKGAASGALTGASVGSVVPVLGTALGAGIGGAIGGVKNMFGKHASTAPTDFGANDARDAIGQQYQSSLGRDASPDEILSQLSGQGWQAGDRYVGEKGLNSVLGSIGQSDEAKQFASRGATPPPVADVAGPVDAQAATGGQKYALEGYDAGKLASGHNSPKYAVGHVLEKYDPKLGLSQPGLLDELNALGIGQFSANSDKLSVANGNADFKGMNTWDSIRDQEGDAGWQFGVDNNLDAAGGQGGGGGQMPQQAGGYNLDPLLTGDPLAKIQAAIAKQAGSGENIRALMNQLGNGSGQ